MIGRGNSFTDHEKEMIDAFEKDGHYQREIAKKINRSRCVVNNHIKIKTKHLKRFQIGPKNSVQGINGPLSEMLENLENPFLKFNFLVTLMFHVGPYGEHLKNALMLNIQRDKKLPHGRNIT